MKFEPTPPVAGPWQSVACSRPDCRRPSFGDPYGCEFHRERTEPARLVTMAGGYGKCDPWLEGPEIHDAREAMEAQR